MTICHLQVPALQKHFLWTLQKLAAPENVNVWLAQKSQTYPLIYHRNLFLLMMNTRMI